MTGVTDDPNDPRLKRGHADETSVPQNEVYLVLSEAERAKGFVRPYRDAYRHVGLPPPKYPLRDLTDEQRGQYADCGYVKYEAYPQPSPDGSSVVGRFWTQKDLDNKGCGTVTTMGRALSETYSRDPSFYGATYCAGCSMHRPVGEFGEFVWVADGQRVGT
jgi:hypothetical protein